MVNRATDLAALRTQHGLQAKLGAPRGCKPGLSAWSAQESKMLKTTNLVQAIRYTTCGAMAITSVQLSSTSSRLVPHAEVRPQRVAYVPDRWLAQPCIAAQASTSSSRSASSSGQTCRATLFGIELPNIELPSFGGAASTGKRTELKAKVRHTCAAYVCHLLQGMLWSLQIQASVQKMSSRCWRYWASGIC